MHAPHGLILIGFAEQDALKEKLTTMGVVSALLLTMTFRYVWFVKYSFKPQQGQLIRA